MTVVETAEFLRKVEPLMSEADRDHLIAFLAADPEAGRVIEGTGGVRKLRWGLAGRGKRGGARVVYYYHSQRLPLFLLTAYPKKREGESHPGRAKCHEALGADPSGGVSGERVGGLDEYKDQDEAARQESGR